MKQSNLIGEKFNRLTVTAFSHSNNGKYWFCKCDCGTENVIASTSHLNSGDSQSCGCFKEENHKHLQPGASRTHGLNKHPIKQVYDNMYKRCYCEDNKRYANYGGRGITICEEWLNNREVFYKWALSNGWEKGLTIDRINNDLGYSPDNCRFVDIYVQMNNTSRNHFLTWNGETKTIAQWERYLGAPVGAIQGRVYHKWSIEKIFTQPFKSQSKRK